MITTIAAMTAVMGPAVAVTVRKAPATAATVRVTVRASRVTAGAIRVTVAMTPAMAPADRALKAARVMAGVEVADGRASRAKALGLVTVTAVSGGVTAGAGPKAGAGGLNIQVLARGRSISASRRRLNRISPDSAGSGVQSTFVIPAWF